MNPADFGENAPFRDDPPPAADRRAAEPGDDALTPESAEPLRAHAAHHDFEKVASSSDPPSRPPRPSHRLDPQSPEVLRKLEMLDDAVFDAINGFGLAFARLQTLWPAVLAELGEDLVNESREQYLRYAIQIWEQLTDPTGLGDVTQAAQAAEVVCLLFDEG